MRHDFDRQAPFEELLFVEIVNRRRFSCHERVVEAAVFRSRQRTIQVVTLAIVNATGDDRHASGAPWPDRGREGSVPSARRETPCHVEALGQDDGTDGVVEVQCSAPTSVAMSADSDSDVSGPVAMMSGYIAGSVGMEVTSSRATVMSG